MIIDIAEGVIELYAVHRNEEFMDEKGGRLSLTASIHMKPDYDRLLEILMNAIPDSNASPTTPAYYPYRVQYDWHLFPDSNFVLIVKYLHVYSRAYISLSRHGSWGTYTLNDTNDLNKLEYTIWEISTRLVEAFCKREFSLNVHNRISEDIDND